MESKKKRLTFKEIARKKQAGFFEENYGIHEFATIKRKLKNKPEPVEIYVEALLKVQDAMDGKIFYEGFRSQIMDAIKTLNRKGIYTPSGMMMCHTLRSEHIPWNVFFPMSLDEEKIRHAKEIFSTIIDKVSPKLPKIKEIVDVKIEFAPKDENATEAPFTRCYLNDRTSFDTYIEYIAVDGTKGGIGIEVKYTEVGYQPTPREREAAIDDYKNPKYRYWDVMKKSGYFIPEAFSPDNKHPELWSPLVSNDLRQIWRNHLLGASMVQQQDIEHFLSLHLYPAGNLHFHGDSKNKGAVREYEQWLSDKGRKTWAAITFEELFALMREYYKAPKDKDWITYLQERYLF
jgi:hypothetical protein